MKFDIRNIQFILFFIFCSLSQAALSQASVDYSYKINSGDVISINVWGEDELSLSQVVVGPDGRLSLPIIGVVTLGGSTIEQAQKSISDQYGKFLKDTPTVVITVLDPRGYVIYITGKVARPGEYPLRPDMDVLKALSLAGGISEFAKKNSIKILRRDSNGSQRFLKFRYGKVIKGKRLADNILLQRGDVVIVP